MNKNILAMKSLTKRIWFKNITEKKKKRTLLSIQASCTKAYFEKTEIMSEYVTLFS